MSEFLAPTLVTERLRLRGFHPADLAALAAIYADPAVMRYIRDGARTTAQTAANIDAYGSEWALHEHGVWAVVDRVRDTLLGMCGFVERAEIGYILGRASWGQGIATEAAGACLWYGFTRLGFDDIGAGALEDNVGSRRVLEKLGMRPQANEYFDSQGGVYYHLPRADYHPRGPTPTLA
jgi:RimJ/RimL family protein N-acetyltransferase